MNARDGLFKNIKDPTLQKKLLVDFVPLAESKIGELTANFDIVIGVTPDEKKVEKKTQTDQKNQTESNGK